MSHLYAQIHAAHHIANISEETLLNAVGVSFGVIGVGQEPPADTLCAKQVHGDGIVNAQNLVGLEGVPIPTEADGIYTLLPEGRTIAVKTADCLPVICASKDGAFGMVVHAGWRGLAKGIVKKSVLLASEHGVQPKDLVAFLGPAISGRAYQVGPEVMEHFLLGAGKLSGEGFGYVAQKSHGDRWHLDIQTIGLLHLLEMGVLPEQISVLHSCTFEHQELWHSYRRNAANAGRNHSYLTLREMLNRRSP